MPAPIQTAASVQLIEWLGYGRTGGYIHSVFSKACNCVFDGEMISVLCRRALPEPMSLWLDEDVDFLKLGVGSGAAAAVSVTNISLGGIRLGISVERLWNEQASKADSFEKPNVERAVAVLDEFLSGCEHAEGAGALWKKDGERFNRYLPQWRERAKRLVCAREEAELIEAMNGFVGLGPGLTPSGDDALCGYMITALELGDHGMFTEIVQQMDAKTNDISLKSLRLAAQGRRVETVGSLLNGLLYTPERTREVQKLLCGIALYGSTSGTDLLCGMSLALHRHIYHGKLMKAALST